MSSVYRRPDPAYYWALPSVEGEPIWGEPCNYYRGVPQGWGYGKYEGGPYWYRHRPDEDGYYYNGLKYRDQGPQFYERDGRDFSGDFGRGFGRDFSPFYVYPSPGPAAAFRPFHPGDQFRHPDEYPMRFVPLTYGSSSPWEMEQVKQHCCGCPNHVCHPETRPVKRFEQKGPMDGNPEDAKAKLQNMQELAGPVMWFKPSERCNRASDSKDWNEQKEKGKEEHPLYWIPVNQNRNDGFKGQVRQFPGYGIPLALNQRPQGGEEEKMFPGYWIPLDLSHRPQGWQEDQNTFPGYWIPLDLSTSGREEDKKNSSSEEKLQPFPVIWIPDGNWKAANPQEGAQNEILEEVHKKTNEADSRPVIVQQVGKEDEKQGPVEGRKETKVRDIPVKQLEEGKSVEAQKTEEKVSDNHKVSPPRASKLPEVGREDEKQGPVEGRKETMVRGIPVKQLEEGKSVQAQKTEENVRDKHKASLPRASKLPPVCLRVDPLPVKKKYNGKSSSRSPSPSRKGNTKDNATIKSAEIPTSNGPVGKNLKPDASNVSEEANYKLSKAIGEEKKSDENESSKTSRLTSEVKNAEDLKASKVTGEAMKVEDNLNVECQQARVKKTELGRDRAASKIQASYRGCQVRKLQPLRKLREIAKIRKCMEELKQQILSSEFVGELSRDNKTKGRMIETLICLLLQLDTIQGLHPVVGDVRKSVAQELGQLQEKLDALVKEAHTDNPHPCMTDMTENNVTATEEKIGDRDKGLEATEDSGKTLLNTSAKNQRVENEIRKDEKNAQEKETFKWDSLVIGNEVKNDNKDNAFVEKEANNNKEETANATAKYGENVEDNAFVQQEALEVDDNLEIPSLSMHTQKSETLNEDENVMNERELVSLATSQDITSIVDNTEMLFQTVAIEKSEPSPRIISVGKEEKSEPNKLEVPDSALPQELGTAIEKERCPASTLVQEQEVAASDILYTLDENANALGKNETLERGEVVIESKTEPETQFSSEKVEVSGSEENKTGSEEVQNDSTEKTLGDDKLEFNMEATSQTIFDSLSGSPSDILNTLDENVNALGKNETLDRGEEVIKSKTEPETPFSSEKVDVSCSEENKTESEEVQNDSTEKTLGDDNFEFNMEAASQTIFDSLSGSPSEGINLNKVEKALPAAENLSKMGKFAAAMSQGTDDPIVEQSTVAPITGDGLSTMNTKNYPSIQNVEHAPMYKGPSDGTKSGAYDKIDILKMESPLNKNDLVHSEDISESEVNISKSIKNQDHEKWEDENEKLREMVEKLVDVEKNQMSIIAHLNDKINQLEDKLTKGKVMRKARAGQLRLRSDRVARNTKNATALG